jgi:hypothetical protein
MIAPPSVRKRMTLSYHISITPGTFFDLRTTGSRQSEVHAPEANTTITSARAFVEVMKTATTVARNMAATLTLAIRS